MGERLGLGLGESAGDITFIALRLGWVQPGENDPDEMPDDWSRALPLFRESGHGPPVPNVRRRLSWATGSSSW